MTYMLDEIILGRMMTALDLEFERPLHYHDAGMRATTAMGAHPRSQDLSVCTPCSQQRPPFTELTSPQPSTQSHPSLPDILEACHSEMVSNLDNKDPIPTADLDDPVWDEQAVHDIYHSNK